MGAGFPSTESAILTHHVTMLAGTRQKAFVFVYHSGIEIQEFLFVSSLLGVCPKFVNLSYSRWRIIPRRPPKFSFVLREEVGSEAAFCILLPHHEMPLKLTQEREPSVLWTECHVTQGLRFFVPYVCMLCVLCFIFPSNLLFISQPHP